jgi:spore coat polysaccharide biosynthesis predicted glycosyltransferase SpsG
LEPSGGDYALFVPGAADVLGCSEVIIEWWPSDGPELIVVLGPLVPECRRSNAWAALSGRKNIKILCDPGDFAHILSGAGFVICTASVTAYEALAMEKWTAVFSVAPNQDGLGATLAGLGAAYDLGGWEGMSAAKLVDAISFKPALALKGFVSKDGAILCADELLKLLGVNCDDR